MSASKRPLGVWMVCVILAGSAFAAAVPPAAALRNGQAVPGLSGQLGAGAVFRIDVPSGAVYLEVISSGGRRLATLKSVPLVYATGSSAAWVTPSGIPSSSAASFSRAR